MSAKKAAKKVAAKTITMGIHSGKEVTITKKKAPTNFVVVIIEDEEIMVPKSMIR